MEKGVTNNPHGRPKGIKDKRTLGAEEIAQRMGVSPFEILLLFASGDAATLNLGEGKEITPELRQKAAKDACEYLLPKLKAVEITDKGRDAAIESLENFLRKGLNGPKE
jgi:hypothetical protein